MVLTESFDALAGAFCKVPVPQALTRVNDTNVTLTLDSAATGALLAASALTLGWSGTLAVSRGGIGAGTLTGNGVLYGNGTSAVQATSAAGAFNVLTGNSGAPSFTDSPTFGGTVDIGGTTQSIGTSSFIYTDVATGNASITTGNLTALRCGATFTIGGNSAVTLGALFNGAMTFTDDGSTRTVGPALVFASQPTYTATVATGLTVNDLSSSLHGVVGFYFGPSFTRSGSGTGTATTVCGVQIGSAFNSFATGWTITTYEGVEFNLPGTLTATVTNVYGFRNKMAAASGRFAIFSDGTAQSAHAGNFKIGASTAPADVLDVAGTIRSDQFTANGAVATGLTSVGPTGSHTTVQEWLQVKNSSGTVRYIPAF